MLTRRRFVVAIGAGALAPLVGNAQPKQTPAIVGWLQFSSREMEAHTIAALREGLAALGWKEGSQFGMALTAATSDWVGETTTTAGFFAASSAARDGRRSMRPSPQRSSMTNCEPSFQPSAASPSLNAAIVCASISRNRSRRRQ